MSNLITVQEMSRTLDNISQDSVRRGIIQGTLPGIIISNDGRKKYIIPRKATELFLATGITPVMLAQSVMKAETFEQGMAYLRAALMEDIP